MKKYLLIAIILIAAILRLYKLGSVPPALYWDEASLGYNAYSILKSARDEHGRFLPNTNFAAFGDYKPPLYIYATVPSIAVFGISEFAIRFPSSLAGILTVLLSYFIAKKLFSSERAALLTAFFLAISPWHIQMSRAAFEANLGLFFSTLGVLTFLKFATVKPFWIFVSALSFLAAVYTFTGQRLFVPFIVLILFVQFRKQVVKNIRYVAVAAIASLILFWPLYVFVTQTIEGRLRFNEVTIFKDLEPSVRSTRYRTRDNFTLYSNIFHNRRLLYAREYLIHYFDAFNPNFLFIRGDVNPRLSIQEVGELYLVDSVLIFAGTFFLFAKKQKYRFLIVGWLLISPLGPATARETPHALRMIHILPTFQMIAAFGLLSLYIAIKFKKAFIAIVSIALILNLIFYLHMYYSHWPKNYSGEWQYGYKQAIETIKPLYDSADYIVVSRKLGRPYIYFLLYLEYQPQKYWQTASIIKDQFFFIDVPSFDKFRFVDDKSQASVSGNIIYLLPEGSTPADATLISTIKDLQGKVVFEISKTFQ